MYKLDPTTMERKGRFKAKRCRHCEAEFNPSAPSQLYCSDQCAADGKTSAYLNRTYGITINDYREMLEEQGHRCKLCGSEGFTMKDSHNIKLVVDHCHKDGHVRGLLCHNCNRALGLLQDDKETLQKAIDYLS
jgi:hypothetical protein